MAVRVDLGVQKAYQPYSDQLIDAAMVAGDSPLMVKNCGFLECRDLPARDGAYCLAGGKPC